MKDVYAKAVHMYAVYMLPATLILTVQLGMTDHESDISTNKHIFDIACRNLCSDAAVCQH